MSKYCTIFVLISLLFALQTRAGHVCFEAAGSHTTAATALDGSMLHSDEVSLATTTGDQGGSPPHGVGHCDVCAHVSIPAPLPAPVLAGLRNVSAELSIPHSLGAPLSPPLGRPDKPPR